MRLGVVLEQSSADVISKGGIISLNNSVLPPLLGGSPGGSVSEEVEEHGGCYGCGGTEL